MYLSAEDWLADEEVLHVTDPKIYPARTYFVHAHAVDGSLSPGSRTFTRVWGDVGGSGGLGSPDGTANVIDIGHVVDRVKNLPPPQPIWYADLASCEADGVANVIDIGMTVDAVKAMPFPCGTVCTANPPTGCESQQLVTAFPPTSPYRFTGRRLDLELRDPNTGRPDLVLYDYRARAYDAVHGRFMQRDPVGYMDGMNIYQAFHSNPLRWTDPLGKWNADVHEFLTAKWADDEGITLKASRLIAIANISTDGPYGAPVYYQAIKGGGTGFTISLAGGDQSRHFNRRPTGRDTRLEWRDKELRLAIDTCTAPSYKSGYVPLDQSPETSALHLGRSLHSIQDWWAHGDLSTGIVDIIIPHISEYDNPQLDAFGIQEGVSAHTNGRAPQVLIRKQKSSYLDTGLALEATELQWRNWEVGNRRLQGTEDSSRAVLRKFVRTLKQSGTHRCRCYFLRDSFE